MAAFIIPYTGKKAAAFVFINYIILFFIQNAECIRAVIIKISHFFLYFWYDSRRDVCMDFLFLKSVYEKGEITT